MAAPKRSKIQRERDRLTIAELSLKGWSQQRIADFMELNKSNICRELKKIKAAWKTETIDEHGLYVQKELQRLSMLEAEYWAGWERSQQSKESSLDERLGTGGGERRVKLATRTEQRVDEAIFLNGIQKVIEARCKLLGLYAESNGGGVSPSPTGNGAGLSDQAADAIRRQILGIPQDVQQ